MVAFITSLIVMVVLMLPVFWYAKRRHVGDPFTWGEATVAGTYVFALLFWAYGVVPHQWLTWADTELGWRPDVIWFGPGGSVTVPGVGWVFESNWFPMTLSAEAFRDIIATLIYVVLLGVQIWLWVWWQNRDKRAAEAAAVEPTTAYGRPLIKRA
ncbi:MAG: hypothetical protein ACR2OH_08335 [Microthrixaceae bacterium]